MLDPELPDGGVRVRQREAAVGERVGEAGGVEIHPEAAGLGPVDPALEMLHGVGVALDLAAAQVRVAGVEIDPVPARDERQRLLEVGAQLFDRAGLARIIAGGLDAAAGEHRVGLFKTAHVVALPAMEGDRRAREGGEHRLGVDPEGGIIFPGE